MTSLALLRSVGRSPAEVSAPDDGSYFREAAKALASAYAAAGRAPRTAAYSRQVVGQFDGWLRDDGRSTDPEDRTPADIEAWTVSRREATSPRTALSNWVALKATWNWAVKRGLIENEPFKRLERPVVDQPVRPVLTAEDARAIIATTEGSGFVNRRDRALLLLAAGSLPAQPRSSTGPRPRAVTLDPGLGLGLEEKRVAVRPSRNAPSFSQRRGVLVSDGRVSVSSDGGPSGVVGCPDCLVLVRRTGPGIFVAQSGGYEEATPMSRRITFLAGMLVLSLAACSPGPATSPAVSSSSAASSARPTGTPGPTPTPQVAEACASKAIPFDAENIELSGPWRGNDGGIYYLRQRDNVVWWNGMSGSNGAPSEFGREWNNVGRGEIRDLIIFVEWADVPRGRILDGGTLEVTIGPDASGNLQLTKTRELEGDFGNGGWTPCTVG